MSLGLVLDDVFSTDDLQYIERYIRSTEKVERMYDPVMSKYIWDRVNTSLPDALQVSGYLKYVTSAHETPTTLMSVFYGEKTTLVSNVTEDRYYLLLLVNTVPNSGFVIKRTEDAEDEEFIPSRSNRIVIYDCSHFSKHAPFTEGEYLWLKIELITALKSSDT